MAAHPGPRTGTTGTDDDTTASRRDARPSLKNPPQRSRQLIIDLERPAAQALQQLTDSTADELERHYRALVERPGLMLVRVNPEGKLIYISPRVKEITAYPAQEFHSSAAPMKQLLHPEDVSAYSHLIEARRGRSRKTMEAEYRVRHTDGTYHWLYQRQTPMIGENGQIEFFDSLVMDIHERKQLEAQLIHAQRMETMGTFAAGIAHDFNNYLAAILGQVSLTLSELDPGHGCYGRLAAAEQAVLCCAEITRCLLTFGKQTELKRAPVNMLRLLDEIAQLLRHVLPATIEITLSADANLKGVSGSYAQLQQVLMNLAINSRDAMPKGGRLQLRARNLRLAGDADRRIPSGLPGDYVEIAVADTGEGIPASYLPYVFDPFFSTKRNDLASGLGLSTAYSIIRAHQGFIQVSSEKTHGAVFTVLLPAVDLPEESAARMDREIYPQGEETVLVADDDEFVLSMVKSALSSHGYSVITASDGLQAVGIFKSRAGKIDLVLLDQTMPKLTAREVLNELYSVSPELRVVLTSGYGEPVFEVPGNPAFFRFISKPFLPGDLLVTVRQLLDVR